MRTLAIAALLGSGLCAQTPPVQTSDPDALEQHRELNRRFVLPRTWVIVPPGDTGRLGLPAVVGNLLGHPAPASGRTCSIPLIDVAPTGGFTGDPKIAIPGSRRLGNLDHMPLIQGSPPCPQVKR